MIRRVMGSTVLLAAVLLAGETVYAAPRIHSDVPGRVKTGKTKLVSFQLRNDSKQPLKVKVGDQELTLVPGKATAVKLASGTTIVAEETTADITAGSVLATVNPAFSNATVALK